MNKKIYPPIVLPKTENVFCSFHEIEPEISPGEVSILKEIWGLTSQLSNSRKREVQDTINNILIRNKKLLLSDN